MGACGSQLKAIGERRVVEESSEGEGVGAPASATEQATASRTKCATAVEEQIEQSKRHWSCLSTPAASMLQDAGICTPSSSCLPDDNNDEEIELDNKAVFKELSNHSTWGGFFHIFGDDTGFKWKSGGSLEVGEKFAEGAQAELFHVRVNWSEPKMIEWDVEIGKPWVLKVFKKGTLLRHLQSTWPQGYLRFRAENTKRTELGEDLGYRWHCDVVYGTLLEGGRFAFMMIKEDEDLRSLIDRKMKEIGHHRCGPFFKEEEENIMYRIARGMDWLHNNNIVHRDLKASNVLVDKLEDGPYRTSVADFECSIGVVGTGFFRAPEILQACNEKNVNERPELFSKAADVYSYGMTCYEVLTGKLPFENHPLSEKTLIDHVINHNLRPKVPKYVNGWIVKLLHSSWQSNVDRRPTFEKILSIFESSSKSKYIIGEARARKEARKAQIQTTSS